MESNHSALPLPEWPKSVSGDMVWSGTGATLAAPRIIELHPADIKDIESAVQSFKGQNLHGDKVCQETFPLSDDLKGRLEEASTAVHEKEGYCVLRGLTPAMYSPEDNALIFLGLASYVGNVRGVQDSHGNMMSHITVAKEWEDVSDKLRHTAHTTKDMPFHNDMGADVIALHYRQCAKEGGLTHLTSAWTIYNELAADHPAALKTLATPNWPIQITNSKSRARHQNAPLIQFHEGKIMVSLDPGRLGRQTANKEHISSKTKPSRGENAPASQVPSLTQEQQDALDTLKVIAKKHQVAVTAQPGDIVFVNNWGLLHARDSYLNAGARRHLVRLWLHNEDKAWKAPESMKLPWAAAYGYHFKKAVDLKSAHPRNIVNRKYPITPAPEYPIPKYTAGSAAFTIDSSDEEWAASDDECADSDDDAIDGDFLVT